MAKTEPGDNQDISALRNKVDIRDEVVKFALRMCERNGGRNLLWISHENIRKVIEKQMFSQVEDLLPLISFRSNKDGETEREHMDFMARMTGRGG